MHWTSYSTPRFGCRTCGSIPHVCYIQLQQSYKMSKTIRLKHSSLNNLNNLSVLWANSLRGARSNTNCSRLPLSIWSHPSYVGRRPLLWSEFSMQPVPFPRYTTLIWESMYDIFPLAGLARSLIWLIIISMLFRWNNGERNLKIVLDRMKQDVQ